MDKNEYLDKVEQLRSVLEANMLCCETILQFIDSKRKNAFGYSDFIDSPIGTYLNLICNNHFYESISILNTLFFPQKDELSPILNMSIKLPQKDELNKIRDEFLEKGFQELRHNFIGHKNNSKILSPLLFTISPVSLKTYKEAKSIFDKYTLWFHKYYDDIVFYSNPHLANTGIQKLIEFLEENPKFNGFPLSRE